VVNTPSVAVLVTGEPVPQARARRGDFADLIRLAAPGFGTLRWEPHDVRARAALPDLTRAFAVIVTGSALSVTEPLPWKEQVSACLRELVRAEVPLLGICFGHQLLGHALGGHVSSNPHGREMGTVDLERHEDDPVCGLRGRVPVNTTHVDSVVTLPPGARVLGSTPQEPHAAVRFGPSAWGVQYHPELDAEVMRYYFEARRPLLQAEGWDVEAAERAVRDAPEGARVIERFLQLAEARWSGQSRAEPGVAEHTVAARARRGRGPASPG
jgi:GMP synthase (glutamine-hydrolysing)